ncbi:MAG: hypothetical protein BWY31_03813 [Lentisphaerae bacterium ADurb.Bin242]|nr:MAG: hypothetical protein BWY31_03813 [Lentisphaerae bacterium ADurb.Bin242]
MVYENSQSILFQQKPLYTKTSIMITAIIKPGMPENIRKNSIANAITKRTIFNDINRIFLIFDPILSLQ